MPNVVVSMVVFGRGADGKDLEFDRNQSAFDTHANPAVRFPVIHKETFFALVTFMKREGIFSLESQYFLIFGQCLGRRFEVEVVFGIDDFDKFP